MEQVRRELEVRIQKHNIKTKSELKTVMVEKWMNNDRKITKKLEKSISGHLKTVVDNKVYPIKH